MHLLQVHTPFEEHKLLKVDLIQGGSFTMMSPRHAEEPLNSCGAGEKAIVFMNYKSTNISLCW